MRRRYLCVVLLISLVICAFCLHASAANEQGGFDGKLNTSAKGLEMIKSLEGFIETPRWDVSQYSIGYGCNTNYAKKYGFNPNRLTQAEAHDLMCCVINELELEMDMFLSRHGIVVNQYQYDALISLTYNIGKEWMDPNSRLVKLMISNEYTVNELASAFGIYCHVVENGVARIESHLVSRRIQEIKLFLYGAYKLTDVPEQFIYVKFASDEGGYVETDIGFYLVGEPYQDLFEAVPDRGTYFAGWYTASGRKVTASDIADSSTTLYAEYSGYSVDPESWIPGEIFTPDGPPITGSGGSGFGDEDFEYQYNVCDVFSDMSSGAWYFEYVNDLYNRSIINGYEDATFRPERTVTTGEALKMILLAAGYWNADPVTDHWASGYLRLALDEGILDSGDITDLDVPISRVMMAKISANALGLERLYEGTVFTDSDNKYVCALHDWGITEGYEDGSFRPDRSLTRAELSAIVWRIYYNF